MIGVFKWVIVKPTILMLRRKISSSEDFIVGIVYWLFICLFSKCSPYFFFVINHFIFSVVQWPKSVWIPVLFISILLKWTIAWSFSDFVSPKFKWFTCDCLLTSLWIFHSNVNWLVVWLFFFFCNGVAHVDVSSTITFFLNLLKILLASSITLWVNFLSNNALNGKVNKRLFNTSI